MNLLKVVPKSTDVYPQRVTSYAVWFGDIRLGIDGTEVAALKRCEETLERLLEECRQLLATSRKKTCRVPR